MADSAGPPAMACTRSTTVPFRVPILMVVASHGMFGWFHSVQASIPSSESSGVA